MAEEPTLEQTKQLQRNLTEKVLDRAASDPEWRQRLLEDSEAAMREAAFPEAERLAEIHQASRPQPAEGEEVRGQSWPGGGGGGAMVLPLVLLLVHLLLGPAVVVVVRRRRRRRPLVRPLVDLTGESWQTPHSKV